jgi:hypothetical protein
MVEAPVVIYPPLDGRRRVQIRGERVGVAVGITDVLEFLRRAGLDLDAVDLEDPAVIEWRGGGPDDW